MRTLFTIILSFTLFLSFSQNEYLDYIIKDTDTIYGKFTMINKFIDVQGKTHKLRKINTIRFNDNLYKKEILTINSAFKKKHDLDDYVVNSIGYFGDVFCLNLYKQAGYNGLINSIVQTMISSKEKFFIHKEKRLKDYIIKGADTIYGQIIKMKSSKPYLMKGDKKYKIGKESVTSYRYNNLVYHKMNYLKKGKKEKTIFLSKQLSGKLILYIDRMEVNPAAISKKSVEFQSGEEKKYLKINDKLQLIKQERFLKTMYFLFKENKEFAKRIRSREFTYANLYLFVKEYNSKHLL